MRYLMLDQLDWDAPGGVTPVSKPYPVEQVETFVNWLRVNKQWRQRPELLHQRALMLLNALDKVGPLATVEIPAVFAPHTDAPRAVEAAVQGFPCPDCGTVYQMKMHLARHQKAKHPVGV